MPRIEPRRTPQNIDQVESALRAAWQERFSEAIPPDVLALLQALTDVEVGDGIPGSQVLPNSFHNNLGNVTVARAFIDTTPSSWFTLNGDEGPGTGSDASEHFYKAYPSLADGAEGLITLITRPIRQQWWDGLLTGDPQSFVMALAGRNGGPAYFEADPKSYLRTFLRRWEKYAPPSLPGPPPEPDIPVSEPDPFELPDLNASERSQVRSAALVFAALGLGGLYLLSRVSRSSQSVS